MAGNEPNKKENLYHISLSRQLRSVFRNARFSSSHLNIFKISEISDEIFSFPIDRIKYKAVCIPILSCEENSLAIFPLKVASNG